MIWAGQILDVTATIELYDLLEDEGEKKDISLENPGVVSRLNDELKNWQRETNLKCLYQIRDMKVLLNEKIINFKALK